MSVFRVITEPGSPPLIEQQVGQTDPSQSYVFRCPNCNRHVLNGLKVCPCGQQLNWGR